MRVGPRRQARLHTSDKLVGDVVGTKIVAELKRLFAVGKAAEKKRLEHLFDERLKRMEACYVVFEFAGSLWEIHNPNVCVYVLLLYLKLCH